MAGRSRTLHLVDVDNLLGDPSTLDRALIRETFAEYRRASNFVVGDHVVIATGRNGLHVLEVELAWPGVCHRRRAGDDGADLELLESAAWGASCGRFDRVVIGSGDRIFSTAFDELRAADLVVDVVSRHRALSPGLAMRARGRISYLGTCRTTSPITAPASAAVDYVDGHGGRGRPGANGVIGGRRDRAA